MIKLRIDRYVYLKIWSKHLFLNVASRSFFLVFSYFFIVTLFNWKFYFYKNVSFNNAHYLFLFDNKSTTQDPSLVVEENIKFISSHLPKHLKPLNDDQFGYYLAGLIDGDGTFAKYAAHIVFYSLDVSLAYYIKERIGYGSVIKIKSKNAYRLSITSREGLQKLINLINGKLRIQAKCDAVYKHILNVYEEPLNLKEKFNINISKDLDNHWLAGFLDADGSFQVKCLKRVKRSASTRLEIRLNMQVDQKTRLLLDLIKDKLGGNIGFRKSQNTYYYSSTNFGSAKKVINYLDKYHLLSSKYLNFLKWRKVYLLIQEKKHLTKEGQTRILKIKSTMNSYSKETLDIKI